MTEDELKFKIELALDNYADEHAKFKRGDKFVDAEGNVYVITSIFGSLSKTVAFSVIISYCCYRKDGKSFNFTERKVEEFKKID